MPDAPASLPIGGTASYVRTMLHTAADLLHTDTGPAPLIDPFGRSITYVRVSVTDRCDFRCTYCMSEKMTFLPRKDLLSLEELDRLCTAFVARGTRKLRITGGEPLVRRDILSLFTRLSRHLASGALEELTLTTNGSQLETFAPALAGLGVRRVNVSLDTLDADKFRAITRRGDLDTVLRGIAAARDAGLSVKINAVALAGFNDNELHSLVAWAHGEGHEITFIEVMPLGEERSDEPDRFLSLDAVQAVLKRKLTLEPIPHRTGGPARYVRARETDGRIGFITPLSHNFCESCNRVRVTCTGTLFMCLGQNDAADLRSPLRASQDDAPLMQALEEAIARKPKGHDFLSDRLLVRPRVARPMSMTGG